MALDVNPGNLQKAGEPLEGSWGSDSAQHPHDRREIARCDQHQVSLCHIYDAAMPGLSPSACVTHMSEGTLDQFTS